MRINGKYFEIKDDLDQWYEIPLKDLQTMDGLSQWLCHLNEKVWFTENMQKLMIDICNRTFFYTFNGKTHYDR